MKADHPNAKALRELMEHLDDGPQAMADHLPEYDAVEIHRMGDGEVAERYAMVGDMEAMDSFWSSL